MQKNIAQIKVHKRRPIRLNKLLCLTLFDQEIFLTCFNQDLVNVFSRRKVKINTLNLMLQYEPTVRKIECKAEFY